MQVTKKTIFENNGQQVNQYLVSNDFGMSMEVLNLGCAILSLKVPDREGELRDIVLGYQDPKMYLENPAYFGTVIGRTSNRINQGQFMWQGQVIQLEKNDVECNIHGGSNGFSFKVWERLEDDAYLTFKLNSADGEDGYPGEVTCYVSYKLTDQNELIIKYKITTPTESIANLTNHSYFNLNGEDSPSILNHYLKLNADQITEVTPLVIPTGKLLPVEGTPFDFREFKTIGEDIEIDYEQLQLTRGFDHNYVLKEESEVDAIVYSQDTGIQLELSTNSPGVQFYTGNSIPNNLIGKNGKFYKKRSGFCLETQFFPDTPNHQDFLQPIVTKNNPQEFETRFKFSIKN